MERKSISNNPNDSELTSEVRKNGFNIESAKIQPTQDIDKTEKHRAYMKVYYHTKRMQYAKETLEIFFAPRINERT